MIRLLNKLPDSKLGLALSGGVDSMVVAHFLLNGHRDFTAFHFNHGTSHSDYAEDFVTEWCDEHGVTLVVASNRAQRSNRSQSQEEFWRNARYQFLHENDTYNIITAHHLDDCLETWLFSTLNGKPKVIPYRRKNVIRPFMLTTKDDILEFAEDNHLDYVLDDSNNDLKYSRNRIRHNIVPEVMMINPGIHKMIAKLVKSRFEKTELNYEYTQEYICT